MALWDKILGKKDDSPRLPPTAGPLAVDGESTEARDEGVSREDKMPLRIGEQSAKGADILVAPHTTEKTTDFSAAGVYAFKVAMGANKRAVAEAVASRYGVVVDRVRMAVQPAKERRRGRQIGWKSGFKKAMVQLKKGQVIEAL